MTRRMRARDGLLRMSIPGGSVIEQNTDDCEVLFRQKTHRTYEQAPKKVKNPPWKTKGDFLPLICYTFEIIGKLGCKKVFVSDKDFLLQQAIFPSKFAK
ncbi:MAG: hypothetical protein IJB95_06435 [Clostridia bacterium]|nr:hypothetical protein [Clostridia bacterium]